MNGVRRFLGGGTTGSNSPPTTPSDTLPPLLSSNGKPSWPPQPPSPVQSHSDSPIASSAASTQPLFLRKDRQKPLPPTADETGNISYQSGRSTNGNSFTSSMKSQSSSASPSLRPSSSNSPSLSQSGRLLSRISTTPQNSEGNRASGPLNTRDELLMSLLASEAVVSSRDFDILSAEEVEELKKEHQVLSSKLEAVTKKLSLETKIRDAAISLTKVNAPHKRVSKQSDEQLEAATRRVDVAQRDVWRISERASEVHRRLLEHRAGVLSFSVRSMEKNMAPNNGAEDTDGSGYNTPSRSTSMSPTLSSMTSVSTSSKTRFDGAHFFAGHADAQIPSPRRIPAMNEITALEEKLKAATEALKAANKKQADLSRELSHLRLEKVEVETVMGMDLQTAEETIKALERELPKLERQDSQLRQLLQERDAWERDRANLVEEMERRLEQRSGDSASQERSQRELDQKIIEVRELEARHSAERTTWERDRLALQDAQDEIDAGLVALRTLIQNHGILVFSRDSSLQGLLPSIGTHLSGVSARLDAHAKEKEEWDALRRKLEDDVRSGLDKREALARDVEDARREREDARREVRALESRVKDSGYSEQAILRSPPSPMADLNGDASKFVSVLQPLWVILPSPEARAAKFANQRQFRTGTVPASPGSPKPNIASLSELDVRSLKSLYDNRPTHPMSPNMAPFSLEAFAARVQALIADDRALIERLLRFAHAHDLLKKNAERAQKLAQEGNTALETYQKQVRSLEDRNLSLASKQAELQDETHQLQRTIDRITKEKHEVEMQAAEQAETCRQLAQANNTLSARTLTLAEEAASAPEMVRKQLDAQLSECKAALERAQDEIDMMRTSEQSQRIALLDELNTMQTENANLRAQLRAMRK